MNVLIYSIIPSDQNQILMITTVVLLIAFFIINASLTRYIVLGDVVFCADNIKLSTKKDNSMTQINYSEIIEIKGKPGFPHHVFPNGQPEDYGSIQLTFILKDGSRFTFEAGVQLWKISKREKVDVDYIPHLEAVLKDIDPNYQIVDKRSQKYGKGWKRK